MAQQVNAGTAVPGSAGPAKIFPPLDSGTFAPQLIWLALTFGLLYVLMKRFTLPRVSEVIEERKDRVQRDLDHADKLKKETEQALAAYEQALTEARARANGVVKSMHDNLAAEAEKERSKVEAQISQKLADAEARITQMKSKALASVNDIAAETAAAIVAKLIGSQVSRDEVNKALIKRAAE